MGPERAGIHRVLGPCRRTQFASYGPRRSNWRPFPPKARQRLRRAISELSATPRPSPPRGRKLEGFERTYRLALGEYRVVYEIEQDVVLVLVVWVGRRRDAYRRF
ncbi:MAG: type II toxin-antitoxin system RelE/ParE family toxin [Fimbriimonadaceae bacterium]|nr:type II toxin-antitoxin system RelE/ParE family toxin [Fimbriimonadaceae bacterium]